MAVSEKYSIGAVNLNDTVDVLIESIAESTLDLGMEIRREPTSGEVYPRYIAVVAGNPSATFGTYALKIALDAIGLTGLDISTLATGVELFCNKHADGGTRAAGGAHRTFTSDKGLVVPQGLDTDHRGDAVLRYNVIPTSNGTDEPFAISDAATMPALTDSTRFTLGPVSIGGVTIGQMQSLGIEFGVNAVPESAGSELYPSFVSIETIAPVFTCRVSKQSVLAAGAIPMEGKVGTVANTSFYLRKRAAGGTFVADVTAEHIKMTAAGIAVVSGVSANSVEIRYEVNYDGTNAPIVFDTASAIT